MNTQNQHVQATLITASACFNRLVELGATIVQMNIAGRNPVIRVIESDQIKQRYGSGLHITRTEHGTTREIHVTHIEGCQVEWETTH